MGDTRALEEVTSFISEADTYGCKDLTHVSVSSLGKSTEIFWSQCTEQSSASATFSSLKQVPDTSSSCLRGTAEG